MLQWGKGGEVQMIQAKLFREHFYLLEDGDRVRQFLITGQDEALLIDTGFPDSYVIDAVRPLISTPVKVLLTHGDGDHTGGLRNFGAAWLHPGDWDMIRDETRLSPLGDGDVFSCGGYRLEVIEIPGHTPGSVAFFDREHRLLLSGDSVQVGPTFLFGERRNLPRYIESLRKLLAWQDMVDAVLPCHHACPIDASYIAKNLEDAIALESGHLTGTPHPDLPCHVYQGRWTIFYAPARYHGGRPA